MQTRERRNYGLLAAAAGLVAVVYAEAIVGVTTNTGATDWASIITAIVGVLLVAAGLVLIFRQKT